jgi:hypothetical protein
MISDKRQTNHEDLLPKHSHSHPLIADTQKTIPRVQVRSLSIETTASDSNATLLYSRLKPGPHR